MENKTTKRIDIMRLTQLGVLVAIMILFDVTGIGYIKTPIVEITIMMIPVIIGGIVLGKGAGALLGGLFGLTSFLQCFGASAFGALLLGINPIFTAILCFVPRILAGFLVGLSFEMLLKIDKTKLVSFGASALIGSIANTILFVLTLILLFWQNGAFTQTMTEWAIPIDNIWAFAAAIVTINGLIEAAVCFVIAAAISKVIVKFVKTKQAKSTI